MWSRGKSGKSDAPRQLEVTTSLVRSQVPVDLLDRGMCVVSLDRPWTEVPLLFQGFTIETEEQLDTLRHFCDWVVIEASTHILAPIEEQAVKLRRRRLKPFAEINSLPTEMPRSRRVYQNARVYANDMLTSIEKGEDINLDQARPIINDCVESISSNANAMFWMSRIKARDAYTAEHCLRVAIFSVAFAKALNMSKADMEVAGLCGLLHDIGKMQVPSSILNKPGSLKPEEMAEMRRHAEYGYEILTSNSFLHPIVATVCRDHHERIDGQGYPNGLQKWQISRFAKLVSIVDVYDAITSDRCYRKGLPASEAMRILYRERGQQFDPEMIEAFIRMMGIYPPGSLVELTNGEVAMVAATHPTYKLRPKVEILLDADKQRCEPLMVDLKDAPQDREGQPYAIAAPLPDGAYGLTLAQRIDELTSGPSG